MHSTKPQSSQTQTGMQLPQKRFREIAQSRAPSSQFPNRLVPTFSGTQWMPLLSSTMRSRNDSTLTNQVGMAL